LVARRAWLPSRDPACAIDFAQEVVLSQIGRKQQSARDVSVRLFRKEKGPESSHRDAYDPDLFVTMSERGVDDVCPEAAENRPLCVVAIRGSSENRIDVQSARAKGVVKSVVEESALVVAETPRRIDRHGTSLRAG
jgi:lactate dehydrogenase-like 2-hydroxyacid dehydrogenase